jgi:hypothetical protein
MLVIEYNGRTIVVTGWRAWVLAALLFLGLTLLAALVAFVVLGVAITVGAVLLIALPIAIGVAILASLFQRTAR